jgi:hypothetical protein
MRHGWCVAVLLCLSCSALAEGSAIQLRRLEHARANIVVDGRLDEPVWKDLPTHGNLLVIRPEALVEGAHATDIRMFYTERGMYVAYDMEQPAETLVKRWSTRDDESLSRDRVGLALDTSGDGRYGYWVGLALGDNQTDGTVLPERQFNRDWDGAWYGASSITDHGWSAELFLPWSQMAMPNREGARRMGFFASRHVAYLDERWGWPAYAESQPMFMSIMQPLELQGVAPKQQWSFFPYTSATFDSVSHEDSYKAGFDLFWRPSTNFQVTATGNPDFGNVEADDVIVNLTAFETFFPDKRLFFQERQEIFESASRPGQFAGSFGDPVILLHTRRIGGSPRAPSLQNDEEFAPEELGQPTELYGAGKITGQVGNLRYGVLGAAEENTKLMSPSGARYVAAGRDFGALRVLWESRAGGSKKSLGWTTTMVAHPESDALVHGLDFHYLSTSGAWKYDGQLLYSDVDEAGQGLGAYFDVGYTPRPGLRYVLNLNHFDSKFDINDFGFMRRNDLTVVRTSMDWTKTDFRRIRDMNLGPAARYEVNGNGKMIRGGAGTRYRVTFNNLSSLEGVVSYLLPAYDDRNSFDNGTFKTGKALGANAKYQTDASKPLSVSLEGAYRTDGIDGGYIAEMGVGAFWRPVARMNVSLELKYSQRKGWLLHQEDRNMTGFDSEEWRPELNFDYFISGKQQLRVALQWVAIKAKEQNFYKVPINPGSLIEVAKPGLDSDDFTISQLNFQVRYRWQIAPLSDLFVVYTRNGFSDPVDADLGDLFSDAWSDPVGEQIVVKVRYRLGS